MQPYRRPTSLRIFAVLGGILCLWWIELAIGVLLTTVPLAALLWHQSLNFRAWLPIVTFWIFGLAPAAVFAWLTIVVAHEGGHYAAIRYHGLDADRMLIGGRRGARIVTRTRRGLRCFMGCMPGGGMLLPDDRSRAKLAKDKRITKSVAIAGPITQLVVAMLAAVLFAHKHPTETLLTLISEYFDGAFTVASYGRTTAAFTFVVGFGLFVFHLICTRPGDDWHVGWTGQYPNKEPAGAPPRESTV
jgi:peptidase M50-like protein